MKPLLYAGSHGRAPEPLETRFPGGFRIPSRQVHLDFHTSEKIPNVGADFDSKQFQTALKLGHVNSITVFAKCHHGWSYYPTRIGNIHPTLRRKNLLGEQIAACHEIGVRAPIYYTVGFSAHDALTHPRWVQLDKDGRRQGIRVDLDAKPSDKRPEVSWMLMCPSGKYLETIVSQTDEICRALPVDGFFYDICCWYGPCYCPACKREMRRAGLNVADEADARKWNVLRWQRLMRRCNAVIRARHPEAGVFYNGSSDIFRGQYHEFDSHFELEDLPTTWGGYDRFPLKARFFVNKSKDYLAMSGKFHKSWGEFGGFKHPDAIVYEAACMIAFGARCSFGDQLHPSGRMDLATYRNIGRAYRYIERIEDLGLDGQPAANLGLWLTEGGYCHNQGVANMLLESQLDFRVLKNGEDLSRFETIILTGDVRLDKADALRVNEYLAAGGSLLVLGTSGLDPAGRKFVINTGAKYVGPARFAVDYLLAGRELGKDLVDSPFLNYQPAARVKATDGQVLAAIHEPYFDRTYAAYCSHANTPCRLKPAAHPGAVRKGGVVYLAHPLGEIYAGHGARLHRQYFINALRLVHRKPTIEVEMPSSGRVSVIAQPDRKRYVAHFTYAVPTLRGGVQVVEDMVPIFDLSVRIRVSQKIRKAFLAPLGRTLPITSSGGAAKVVVPEVRCHQAVVFEY